MIPTGGAGDGAIVMNEVEVVLVVSLLIALLVRIFWRLMLNLLMVMGIWLIFAAIFFAVLGVDRLGESI